MNTALRSFALTALYYAAILFVALMIDAAAFLLVIYLTFGVSFF